MQWSKSDPEPAVGYQGQGRATARAQPPKRHRSRRLAFGRSRFSVVRQKVVQATFMQVLEFCPTRRVCAPRYHDEPNSNRKERVISLICPPQHWVNTDNTVQSGRKLFASCNCPGWKQTTTANRRTSLAENVRNEALRENLCGSRASNSHGEETSGLFPSSSQRDDMSSEEKAEGY